MMTDSMINVVLSFATVHSISPLFAFGAMYKPACGRLTLDNHVTRTRTVVDARRRHPKSILPRKRQTPMNWALRDCAGSSGGAERPSVDVGSSGDSKSTTAGGLAPSLGLSLGGLPPRGGRSDEAAKAGKKDSLSKPLAGDGAVGAASSVVLDMVTSAFQVGTCFFLRSKW